MVLSEEIASRELTQVQKRADFYRRTLIQIREAVNDDRFNHKVRALHVLELVKQAVPDA